MAGTVPTGPQGVASVALQPGGCPTDNHSGGAALEGLALGLLVGLVCGAVGLTLGWSDAITVPPRRGDDFRFRSAPLLVNASERSAWELLNAMAGPLRAHAVCPKVRLEDIAEADGQDRWRLRGYVKSRHVDFVLVDEIWRPVLVVEVDGSSHQTARSRVSDAQKDRILASARVPVLRLRVGTDWRAQLTAWSTQSVPGLNERPLLTEPGKGQVNHAGTRGSDRGQVHQGRARDPHMGG